ncbi:PREDICTED: auxin response factor 17 isoform X1 [Tarenaya hassleriana]|uniref:auxin response factor 17 isoform X2 n=1 Tax=Tarenaya hassleriana TaxID=28532 RepID=UPI00053C2E4B|nr:PREDICTED: auxin response factor 17 isoform X2 [Tarenaya hassleriana]XP_019058117.1 PREDICTED: auxin response factor 17 isoform X1 [Tarenaya hassleriana]
MPPFSATAGAADVHREVEPKIWRASAGASVWIPSLRARVYYFPQGHVEHCCSSALSSSLHPSMPPVPCVISSVQLLADPVTDEVFAHLVLQPVPPTQFASLDATRCDGFNGDTEEDRIVTFAKILTPSDANNGGGFSVPRFCADSVFPSLDYQAEPPVQTLSITDIHGVVWNFRHIYRGTPRRHLLTTGWSKFVNHKKLIAGDSVVFMKNSRGKMFVGVRRTIVSGNGGYGGDNFSSCYYQISGVAKEDNEGEKKGFRRVGKGKLTPEAVAEAMDRAAKGLPFDVVYYPTAGWSDFVVKAEDVEASMAVYWAPGMRVKMAMETEDSSRITWFQGIISSTFQETGPWRGSPWKQLQVTWDEAEILQNAKRVNPWQVELIVAPNQLHATFPPRKRFKYPHTTGIFSDEDGEVLYSQRGLSDATPPGDISPSLLKYSTIPAGMQGARHYHFGSYNSTGFMGEDIPQIYTNNFLNLLSGSKRESTELNNGSPLSDDMSPHSQSSIQSSGTDPVGNQGPNSARVRVNSFQLFGKIINLPEPTESGADESGYFEEDGSKGSSEIEFLNNTLDSSLTGRGHHPPENVKRLSLL